MRSPMAGQDLIRQQCLLTMQQGLTKLNIKHPLALLYKGAGRQLAEDSLSQACLKDVFVELQHAVSTHFCHVFNLQPL